MPVQDGGMQQRDARVIEAEIRAVLKGRYDTVTSAFQAFDRNKDGYLSRDEAFQALDSMSLGLSKKDIMTGAIVSRPRAPDCGVGDETDKQSLNIKP